MSDLELCSALKNGYGSRPELEAAKRITELMSERDAARAEVEAALRYGYSQAISYVGSCGEDTAWLDYQKQRGTR